MQRKDNASGTPTMTGVRINGERALEVKLFATHHERGSGVPHGRATAARANKWRQGLFENQSEAGGEGQMEPEQNWEPASPENWEKIASGKMDTWSGVEQNGDPDDEGAAPYDTGNHYMDSRTYDSGGRGSQGDGGLAKVQIGPVEGAQETSPDQCGSLSM